MLCLRLLLVILSWICLMEGPSYPGSIVGAQQTLERVPGKGLKVMERKKKPKPCNKKKFNKKKCKKMCKTCSKSKECTKCCKKWCPGPDDGSWSAWGEFSECSATCGAGTKSRTRTCSAPAPANGGKECEGSGEETTSCDLSKCATTPPSTTPTPDSPVTTTPKPTTTPTPIITPSITPTLSTPTSSSPCPDSSGDCEATNGSPCIFPFKDGSTEYNGCANEGGRYYWCATSVYSSGKYKHWQYCPLDGSCPLEGGSCTCKTTSNMPCVFPFKHDGKEYNECLDDGKKLWCATSTTSSGNQNNWGYCPKDGTCPLPPTTAPPSSTPPITPNTTTSPSESASTTVLIKDGENFFSCQIDFIFEATSGFKMSSDFSSSCSPASSSDKHSKNFDKHTFAITTSSGSKIDCKINVVIQDETPGISMVTKAMEKSLECSVDESECVTLSGQHFPTACILPFIHEGRKYQACTDKGGKDPEKLWCATAVDEKEEMTKWGYCSAACGYCGGRDVTNQDTRDDESDCGYDCLIVPLTQMEPKTEGIKSKLLTAPGVRYIVDSLTDWNMLPDSQFQFMQGQPGLFLNCSDGFNHFPCHESIYINCTGNYRFSVYAAEQNGDKATIGKLVKNEVKNVHIGCGPCPMGFTYKVGDEVCKYTSCGIHHGVPDIGACRDLCDKRDCPTFVYSLEDKYCELHSVRIENPSYQEFKDYRLCAREEENLCGEEDGEKNCGIDTKLDSTRLIAELNTAYIFNAIDKTQDPTLGYRTQVFDVVTFDKDNKPRRLLEERNIPKENEADLITLFLTTKDRECNKLTFEDASKDYKAYYPVFISSSFDNLTKPIDKFITDAQSLKKKFNDEVPKLCATWLRMEKYTAKLRENELNFIFNYFYSNQRNFAGFKKKHCKQVDDTIDSIKNSKIFDISKSLYFERKKNIAIESDKFATINVLRNSSLHKKAIGFIQTSFTTVENDCTAATADDIVPLSNTVFFNENEKEGVVIIRVKQDDVPDDKECVKVSVLMENSKRGPPEDDDATLIVREDDIIFQHMRAERELSLNIFAMSLLTETEDQQKKDAFLYSSLKEYKFERTTHLIVFEPLLRDEKSGQISYDPSSIPKAYEHKKFIVPKVYYEIPQKRRLLHVIHEIGHLILVYGLTKTKQNTLEQKNDAFVYIKVDNILYQICLDQTPHVGNLYARAVGCFYWEGLFFKKNCEDLALIDKTVRTKLNAHGQYQSLSYPQLTTIMLDNYYYDDVPGKQKPQEIVSNAFKRVFNNAGTDHFDKAFMFYAKDELNFYKEALMKALYATEMVFVLIPEIIRFPDILPTTLRLISCLETIGPVFLSDVHPMTQDKSFMFRNVKAYKTSLTDKLSVSKTLTQMVQVGFIPYMGSKLNWDRYLVQQHKKRGSLDLSKAEFSNILHEKISYIYQYYREKFGNNLFLLEQFFQEEDIHLTEEVTHILQQRTFYALLPTYKDIIYITKGGEVPAGNILQEEPTSSAAAVPSDP